MTTVTITLEDDLEEQVKEFSDETGMTFEEGTKEMLRRLADIQKFRDLRNKARPYAERAGIESEGDIFDAVSDWREERVRKDPRDQT